MDRKTLVYFQKGFNFSQDGPGNRLVYHLYGCNLRCPWCSNPECFAKDAKTQTQSVEEIADEILRSRPMFFSGGGVTFTGGEPTLQFDALRELLQILKKEGVHTALENNGTHPRLPELFPFLDYLITDLKHPFSEEHRRITGAGNATILSNLRAAAETRQLALRIPLIHGYNTSPACVAGFVSFLSSLPRRPDFTLELLRYHEYGRVKWERHGMPYRVSGGFVSPEEFSAIRGAFLGAGIPLINT